MILHICLGVGIIAILYDFEELGLVQICQSQILLSAKKTVWL